MNFGALPASAWQTMANWPGGAGFGFGEAGMAAGSGAGPTGGFGAPPIAGPQMTGLGFNAPAAQLALSGLQTIGSFWNAFQANKLAKRAFNFQKDFANTNLRNQTQSYNTALEDRVGNRAFVQGMSPEQASAYLSKNRLTLPASALPKQGG